MGLPQKRRLRAFRMPENYVYDALRGYQGSEDRFNIFRVKLGTIPLDARLVWITFDHTKHCAYVCVEHPSFPEYTPGTICEEIPIVLEEFEVLKTKAEAPKAYAPEEAEVFGTRFLKSSPKN
jgi:hypothetical protein